jgi:hypothetical protein
MSSETEFVYRGPKPGREKPGGFEEPEGANWILFAGIMLALAGVLNVIYGIAAIGRSHFFDSDAQYILSELRTWGWVGVGVGARQLLAASSIWRGGSFGRWFGIAAAALSAVAALMSIPGAPFWSLAIFTVDLLVLWALAAYGGQHRRV